MPFVGRKKIVVEMWQLTCERCGHKWETRLRDPRVCPHCHSPYWNRPRTREVKKLKDER